MKNFDDGHVTTQKGVEDTLEDVYELREKMWFSNSDDQIATDEEWEALLGSQAL